jgi:hypothetical protein
MPPAVVPISADEQRLRAAAEPPDDTSAFLAALDDVLDVFAQDGLPYLLMGGIASTAVGRERWTHDIDVFVRPDDARRALRLLATRGFETEETFPDWLYKAVRDDQLVDIIFRSAGDIEVDDEMLQRAATREFMGRSVPIVPPEDLVIIKAIVHAEAMPRHWHDALAVLASTEMDWDYFMRRARRGIRRTLALLLYAQSNDLPVPWWVIERLYATLHGAPASGLRGASASASASEDAVALAGDEEPV